MKETPKMPIWMLIVICILCAVIPFATAGLIVPLLIGYFKSPKKDMLLLIVFIVVFVMNVAGGILQIITNG